MWWKKNQWKVLAPVLIAAVLAAAFWYGGGAPGMQGWAGEGERSASLGSAAQSRTQETDQGADQPEKEKEPDGAGGGGEGAASTDGGVREEMPSAVLPSGDASAPPEAGGAPADPDPGTDRYQTSPVPEGMPQPVEPQETETGETAYTCTLSISCAAILEHLDWLDQEKTELVPEDGWILEPVEVIFYEDRKSVV